MKSWGRATGDRAHFLALLSRIMRRVLVDYARARGTAKRGGKDVHVTWDSDLAAAEEAGLEQAQFLDLDRALAAFGA